MKLAIAAALAALAAWAPGMALGDDAIRAGKWEFSAKVQIPNLPKLPPGITLPPGVKIGAGGVDTTRTACINAAAPMPADLRPPSQQHGQCKVDRLDNSGGAVHWESTCTEPDGSVAHSVGTARYSGNTMEATLKTQISGGSHPMSETSQHVAGRYLGPCDGK